MGLPVSRVAPLLFGSGLCALIYQTAWLRELRLIFGFSTAASAAVLAIFMGGLGLGGVLLGERAERAGRPLQLYARLELLIAGAAAVTPLLIALARAIYTGLGGTITLGLTLGTVARLVLSALVLAAPTVLMGGTLPAAARAVGRPDDQRRGDLAILYGVNTLGAVTGAVLATFVLLELLGTRKTLWSACLLNAIIAGAALLLARGGGEAPAPAAEDDGASDKDGAALPAPRFVLLAAAVVGFTFLLMELVWYRMLGPVLGGSSFTFGLILAVALLGIGLGGVAYALLGESRPATLGGFALTCALEALALAVPYALGDTLAEVALYLRSLQALGFLGLMLAWTLIALLVVFPAAFISGVQFPLLIGLLGRGAHGVGRQVGQAYAFNTVGSILGSLAGGFGLLPLLTAPGTWRLCALLLLAQGAAAAVYAARRVQATGAAPDRAWVWALAPLALTLPLLGATGPTAAWRHSGVGVGRATPRPTANGLRQWEHLTRRQTLWEREGVESSVALNTTRGMAFVVNGKNDGNCRSDAATQVFLGMLGALLHGAPQRALVVGLGTGSTAGWLGALPGAQRVDAVEIEPAIRQLAVDCAVVNQRVLDNPKVKLLFADAREVLLATPSRYDLIVSEPSNPYRAGIASLFTQDFYRAVAARLNQGGLLVQWVQAYEVDAQTVRTIYKTVSTVFPHVDTWFTTAGDLVLISGREPRSYDPERLRALLAQEPYRSAALYTLRVTDVEGLLARFIARDTLSQALAAAEEHVDTDDHTSVEYGYARSVGKTLNFSVETMRRLAAKRGDDQPPLRGAVDLQRLADLRVSLLSAVGADPLGAPNMTPEQAGRARAYAAYQQGDLAGALRAWRSQPPREPQDLFETAMLAEALAEAGDEAAGPHIERLRGYLPTDAAVMQARLQLRRGALAESAATLAEALQRYRQDPWPDMPLMTRAMRLAVEITRRLAAAGTPARGEPLFEALRAPFVIHLLNEERLLALLEVAHSVDFPRLCLSAMGAQEPHVMWQKAVLEDRVECLSRHNDPRAEAAREDLRWYQEHEPTTLERNLPPR